MGRMRLLWIALLLPSVAAALNIIPTSNTVNQVIIFADRAEVTRRVEVELPAGEHTILVSALPAQLFEASLRASGRGEQGLRIATVESRRLFATEVAQERERQLRGQLQSQQDEKARLEGRRQALITQGKFIERLATLPGETDEKGNRLFTPEKWPSAWQAIGQGMSETNAAQTALQQELRVVEETIRKLEQELRQIQTGRRDSITAAMQVQADAAGKAQFDLSYQLTGASWSPIYDASLNTESGKVSLSQAAAIRQSTGEDWRDAQVTVSTARPGTGVTMPELTPWWIDFYQPPTPLDTRRLQESKLEMTDEMLTGAMAPRATPQAAKELVATEVMSEFSVHYRIPGRINVPADNSRHRFVLNRLALNASLSVRSAPKLDPRAFLYAEIDYTGDAPLLPGPWHLQRDGNFIGTSENPALLPGEKRALAFGTDDALEINYQQIRDLRAQRGLISREHRTERQYRITITNRHKIAIPLTVFDQIPVSRDKSITVELLDNTSRPIQRDVENRPGILAWERTLQPQEKQTIDFGYAISFPQDKQVPGF